MTTTHYMLMLVPPGPCLCGFCASLWVLVSWTWRFCILQALKPLTCWLLPGKAEDGCELI